MNQRKRFLVGLLLGAFLPFAPASGHTHGDMAQGQKLYLENCSPCHGENGDGQGPGARMLPVKPANHTDGATMNQRSDEELSAIIVKGGAAVGRSPFMPGWDGQLSEKQIRSLIAYIRSLAVPVYKP